MAKNSFAVDVTFKTCPEKSNKIIILDRENLLNFFKIYPAFIRWILKNIPLFTSCVPRDLNLDTKPHYGKRKNIISQRRSFDLRLGEVIYKWDLQCRPNIVF